MGFKNDKQRKAVMATLNNGASSRQSSHSTIKNIQSNSKFNQAKKLWNGETDSNSPYFKARSDGLSHEDAVIRATSHITNSQPKKVSPIMVTKEAPCPFVLKDAKGNILENVSSLANAERLKMIREHRGQSGLTITKKLKVTKPQALRDNSEVLFNWKFATNSDNRVIRGHIDKQAIPTDDNPKGNDQHFVWVREGKDRGLYAIDKTDIQRVKY